MEWMLGYRQAAPTLGPCPLLPPNTQTSPRALLEGGGRGVGRCRGRGSRKEEEGDWVPSQMEGFAIKNGNGVCGS